MRPCLVILLTGLFALPTSLADESCPVRSQENGDLEMDESAFLQQTLAVTQRVLSQHQASAEKSNETHTSREQQKEDDHTSFLQQTLAVTHYILRNQVETEGDVAEQTSLLQQTLAVTMHAVEQYRQVQASDNEEVEEAEIGEETALLQSTIIIAKNALAQHKQDTEKDDEATSLLQQTLAVTQRLLQEYQPEQLKMDEGNDKANEHAEPAADEIMEEVADRTAFLQQTIAVTQRLLEEEQSRRQVAGKSDEEEEDEQTAFLQQTVLVGQQLHQSEAAGEHSKLLELAKKAKGEDGTDHIRLLQEAIAVSHRVLNRFKQASPQSKGAEPNSEDNAKESQATASTIETLTPLDLTGFLQETIAVVQRKVREMHSGSQDKDLPTWVRGADAIGEDELWSEDPMPMKWRPSTYDGPRHLPQDEEQWLATLSTAPPSLPKPGDIPQTPQFGFDQPGR